MASEPGSSSWHPAAMPNCIPSSRPSDGDHVTQPPSAEASSEHLDQKISHDSEIYEPIHDDDEEEDVGDRSFSNDGDAEGGAGLAVEEHPSRHEVGDVSENDNAVEKDEVAKETTDHDAPTASKHSSSMSFARTVSHDLSFNDDDDPDWTIPRTDADPFKFMAPSDRTNSFPVVPLMSEQPKDDAPLPANQALDVLEETERDYDEDEEEYQSGGHHQFTDLDEGIEKSSVLRSNHAPSRSIGGEVKWSEAEASEARYEEGVPLIQHAGDAAAKNEGAGLAASFDNDDNDDFFNQTHDNESHDADASENIQPLQRKSTMQVLAGTNAEPPFRQFTLDEALDEGEEDEDDKLDFETTKAGVPDKAEASAGLDLASKWNEAFAGDEDEVDFLLDDLATEKKDIDETAFLGSDDEGLLDDIDDTPLGAQPISAALSGGNPYVPSQSEAFTSMSMPPPAQPAPSSLYGSSPHQGASLHQPPYGHFPPPQPEPSKTQSFADKSKGGYSSPYDLPTDLVANTVKPRKRTSLQQINASAPSQPPPLGRSASAGSQPAVVTPTGAHKPPPLSRSSSSSFFEDLPILAKPRSASRQSNRAASPSPYAPTSISPHGPSPLSPPMANQIPQAAVPMASSPGMNLVAPERISPYAPLASSQPALPPPSVNTSRYSPAPGHAPSTQSAPPPTSRYSPAPPASRLPNTYSSAPAAASQPVLPHLPRTSSPLAHFEISNEKGNETNGDAAHPISHPERRASSSYEPRVNRVPSLPPTREVEEEDDSPAAGQYGALQSPPLPVPSAQGVLSPSKRPGSSYVPQGPPAAPPSFVPPPRSQTQSPGATRGGRRVSKSSEAPHRPTSSHSSVGKPSPLSQSHQRAPSLPMNMVAPTDGRELDPLQRWCGAPIVSWGVGGTVVTSFPKSIPRYVMNQSTPSMLRTSGEVKVRNIKDIDPLHDRLAKFPGPLKGKSKKKEVLTWLSAGIDGLGKELPDMSFQQQLSTEAKRNSERLLLWKILRVFIEFDGVLEGTPAVDKAVREILSPESATPATVNDGMFPADPVASIHGASITSMRADGADAGAMEQIRNDLLRGDGESAAWAAVDKRLWGHAMLISNSVSPDLYKRVAQEFVRKEVNHPGQSNESLAALYKILSGNYDDCVDELVPVHARAGLQLVSTGLANETAKNEIQGLDKWKETLTLVLSNRSVDDIRGLNALGKLLSSYGRAEAAHICFLFSRHISSFGGLDDPNVDFVLLGSDHHQQAHQIAKDVEALQLSEVYEYGLSLTGLPSAAAGAPHLAAFKLQHAITLGEYGYRDKAMQYCDMLLSAMSSQTRRSPYYHSLLESAVEDFMTRLKQAPKEESSSWISKPSMNKVSDSVWSRFNKFVAGDEAEGGSGTLGEPENGPFARIGTPNMSRSPSVSNFESFGVGIVSPGHPPHGAAVALASEALSSALTSKYAPVASPPTGSYEPGSQYLPQGGRNSNEYTTKPYEPAQQNVGLNTSQNNGYASPGYGYQPMDHNSGKQSQPVTPGYQPYGLEASKEVSPVDAGPGSHISGYQPYGYEPSQIPAAAENDGVNVNTNGDSSGGYEAPSTQSYGYEPPSYEPDPEPSAEEDGDEPKPRKKSFMDDDDDDISGLSSKEKSKAEKDRENAEMFRKAAEEDAKRAAEQQANKKGWGFGSWFGGNAKKEGGSPGESSPNKPIRAKLGEASSFVYDPELKRWINKKPGAENVEAKVATPPPPKAPSTRSVSGTPPPRAFTPPPLQGRASVPPSNKYGSLAPPPTLNRAPSNESLGGAAPPMLRSVSGASATSGPPSRPTTSMSNASSIDDLLSASAPRKAGQKKPRKSGRYVDVMAK